MGLFVAADYLDAAVVVAVIALVAAILTLRLAAAADGLSVEHFHGKRVRVGAAGLTRGRIQESLQRFSLLART